jgi:alkylation response protein AidB-like acyl-CoA dehydrogenase
MSDTSTYSDVKDAISDLLTKATRAAGGGAGFQGAGAPATAAAVAEMGWSRLTVSQEHGGLGLGLAGLGPAVTLLGEHLVPGTWGDQLVLNALVPQVGGRAAVLADPQAWGEAVEAASLTLTGTSLSGSVPLVAFDDASECLAVPVDRPGEAAGMTLVLVDRKAPGVSLTPLETDDPVHPLARLTLDGVPLAGFEVVAEGAAGRRLHREILAWTRVLVSCELAGVARRVTAETLAYVNQRVQFARPVGSFQAVKHLLAEMAAATEALSALCAATLEDAEGSEVGAAELRSWVLKAYASAAAVRVCELALQAHGGIGFTAEYGLHLFLRRSYFLATWYGGVADLAPRIGARRLEAQ